MTDSSRRAPLEASSGQQTRHRLNRRGDRQLNRALHTIRRHLNPNGRSKTHPQHPKPPKRQANNALWRIIT